MLVAVGVKGSEVMLVLLEIQIYRKQLAEKESSDTICVSPQDNNVEKAIAAAHTFLKKNPTDPYLTKNMNYYKTLFDVEEYLIDHEEQPYEVGTQHCRPSPVSVTSYSHSDSLHLRVCS